MPILKVNDIHINYEIHGEGEPLVLLHGMQGGSGILDDLIPELAARFRVLIFDQRGSGKSDKPDQEYTIELLAEDTIKLMQKIGFGCAHFFGISIGGMIAQEIAISNPEKTKSLILASTLPGGLDHAIKINPPKDAKLAFSTDTTQNPMVRAKAFANVAFAPGFSDSHPKEIKRFIERQCKSTISEVGLSRRLASVGLYHAYEKLGKIICPTLVIAGQCDQLIDYQNAHIIASQIPHVKLVELENAGHLFWIEKKEQIIEQIMVWIKPG